MTEAEIDTAAEGRSRRPRVMPDVIRVLATEILSRRYPVGTTLPRETDLGEEFGVSRTVIREALKVLAAKGLVVSRPRVGTIVCDEENWNILDPQVMAWHGPDYFNPRLFDAILEMRRTIEPRVTALAAKRATLQEIADLDVAWRGMAAAGPDVDRFAACDSTFHQIIYAASHNPIFRQIGGLIDTALKLTLEATAHSAEQRDEAVKEHFAVVEALRLRDETAALHAANSILDLAERDLKRAKARKSKTAAS